WDEDFRVATQIAENQPLDSRIKATNLWFSPRARKWKDSYEVPVCSVHRLSVTSQNRSFHYGSYLFVFIISCFMIIGKS
ncbi:MAG: hypothetical protein JW708_06455, partial [Vallitaleaceae bacterium]|nr:hypothetical protein [Vallitaleaceae bacterium]